jgi:hypothetical protein
LLLFFSFSSINSLSIMQQSTVTTNEWYCNVPSLYQWKNIAAPPNITEPLRKYDRFISFSNTWLAKKHHKSTWVMINCLILTIRPLTLKIKANHKDVFQSTLLELWAIVSY